MFNFSKNILRALLLFSFATSVVGCNKEELSDQQLQFQDIALSMSFKDSNYTRALPPNENNDDSNADVDQTLDGTTVANRVRLVVFRREKLSSDSFIYDPSNDKVVDYNSNTNQARGTIKCDVDYEYQVLGFAYRDETPQQSLSGISGTRNDNPSDLGGGSSSSYVDESDMFELSPLIELENCYFTVKKTDSKEPQISSPEVFYGYCHRKRNKDKDGKEIIEEDDKIIKVDGTTQLEGTLFRVMALLDLTLRSNVQATKALPPDAVNEIKSVSLYSKEVNTQSKITDYEDFKSPTTPLDEDWTLLKSATVSDQAADVRFIAFLLGVDTQLKLMVTFKDNTVVEEILKFKPLSYDDGGNATGVISPVAQDENLYVKRNQRYNITGILDHSYTPGTGLIIE